MTLSELIETYGNEEVGIQHLDQCASDIKYNHKKGTAITFHTSESTAPQGLKKMGLVLWMDRERVDEIIEAEKHSK